MDTLLLQTDAWDLCLDSGRNIAVASAPYSQAQDAASNCRLFRGEYIFDVTQGVPYLPEILGVTPIPFALIKQSLTDQALAVPGVVDADVIIAAVTARTLTGQVQLLDNGDVTAAVTFTTAPA